MICLKQVKEDVFYAYHCPYFEHEYISFKDMNKGTE